MGNTRDLFKKIRDTKGTFHAKMDSIKERYGMDLTEAEDIKKKWQKYTELYKKDLHDPDNHDGVITHLEPDSGEGNGNPLQYFCLENPMDGGAWQVAVHGVARSRTRLSDFTFTFHFHALEKEMATHSSVLAWRIPGTGSLVSCRLWSRTESDTTEATQQQQQQSQTDWNAKSSEPQEASL